MSPDHTVRILQQLLAATSASTQAYRSAACTVSSQGFATLFAEYARDHARVASWLSRQVARVYRQHEDASHRLPPPAATLDLSTPVSTRDPYALLAWCTRLQDVVLAEFEKARTSSLSEPLRRYIAREHEQLRWAREGLERLGRDRTTPGTRRAGISVMEQLRQLEARSFEPERFDGYEQSQRAVAGG